MSKTKEEYKFELENLIDANKPIKIDFMLAELDGSKFPPHNLFPFHLRDDYLVKLIELLPSHSWRRTQLINKVIEDNHVGPKRIYIEELDLLIKGTDLSIVHKNHKHVLMTFLETAPILNINLPAEDFEVMVRRSDLKLMRTKGLQPEASFFKNFDFFNIEPGLSEDIFSLSLYKNSTLKKFIHLDPETFHKVFYAIDCSLEKNKLLKLNTNHAKKSLKIL